MSNQHKEVPVTKSGTSEALETQKQAQIPLSKAIDNEDVFTMAVAQASQNSGAVEVSQRLYNILTAGQRSPYLMYKNVRVYKEGTKEYIEKYEQMPLDKQLEIQNSGVFRPGYDD